MIQLIDLARQYNNIKDEIKKAIDDVLESHSFILGEYVSKFENKFAKLHGAKYCSGCSNGTSALFLALKAMGIKNDDEVLTVPNTFIATAEAICHVNAKPVFVDIDYDTYNMDVTKLESYITDKTKAIIPVHLYGNPVNMDAVMKIAKKHNLKVLEDCAQAHLTSYNNKKVGSFGDAGTFSFFPGKNLGAFGDAGAVITNSLNIEDQVRKLLNHGRAKKYYHEIVGYNERMDGLQASVLLVKMQYIEEWTKRRSEIAKLYDKLFGNNPTIKIPVSQENSDRAYHLYVIQVGNRQEVMEYLKSKGIVTSIHYPVPLHLQPAFEFLGYKKGDFPEVENIANRIVSLPLFPELNNDEVEFIADEVNKVAR